MQPNSALQLTARADALPAAERQSRWADHRRFGRELCTFGKEQL